MLCHTGIDKGMQFDNSNPKDFEIKRLKDENEKLKKKVKKMKEQIKDYKELLVNITE